MNNMNSVNNTLLFLLIKNKGIYIIVYVSMNDHICLIIFK